jgi:hypothetical protein
VTEPGAPDSSIGGGGEPAGPLPAGAAEPVEHPVVAWARALWEGLADTAREALDEGRRGAQEAYAEGWQRFDEKTRYRRRGREG